MSVINKRLLTVCAVVLALWMATVATAQDCQVPNCVTCSTTSSFQCTQCASGFIMDQNTCHPQGTCGVTNCATCMSGSISKCSVCNAGYSLTTAYLCARGGNGAAAPLAHAGVMGLAAVAVLGALAFAA